MTRHEIEMAEKKIKIPKLSHLKNEEKMFADLHEFLAVVERLYYRSQDVNTNNSVIFVMRGIKFSQDLSDGVLRELISTLQKLASDNQSNDAVIFASKLISQLRKKKDRMKNLITQHMEEIEKLIECQRSCWRSRAKVQKYSLMVDMAQKSLRYHNEDKQEVRERTAAIKELKKNLGSRQKLHTRNIFKFEKVQEKENSIRNELIQLAETLEETITEKIKHKIQSMVKNDEQNEENLDLETVSKYIYDLVSRSYSIMESPTDITSSSFNKVISRPEELPSVYNQNDTKRILAFYQYKEEIGLAEKIKNIVSDPNGETLAVGDVSKKSEDTKPETVNSPEQSVKAKKKGLFAFMKRR